MSVHKVGKYLNLIQNWGIVHTGYNKTGNIGIVGDYDNGGTTNYTGLTRGSDGVYYLFNSLATTPFSSDAFVNPASTTAAAFSAGAITAAGLLTASAAVTISSGDLTVSTGNVAVTAGTVTAGGAIQGTALTATTGNIVASAGNVTAASGSVTGGNLSLSGNTLASTNSNGDITLAPNGTGNVLLTADPTAALGAATKQYVDNFAQGLDVKASVRVHTVGNMSVTAAGSGVGKTLTRTQNGAISGDTTYFDGITLVSGDRVLVAAQTTGADNGIYTVTDAGSTGTPWVLTRATDADENTEVTSGLFTFIEEGTTYATSGWVLSTANPITVDTTALTFVQFSQSGTVTGTQLDASDFNVFRDKTGSTLNFRALAYAATASANTTLALEATLINSGNTIQVNFDQAKITGTGALASGSIATGFGTISTGNTITTTNTVTAATLQTTGGSIAATGGTVTFAAGTGNNVISIGATIADALSVKDSATNMLSFDTTTTGGTGGFKRVITGNAVDLYLGGDVHLTGSNPAIWLADNTTQAFTVGDTTHNNIYIDTNTGAQKVELWGDTTRLTATNYIEAAADLWVNSGTRGKVSSVNANTTLDATYQIVNVSAAAAVTITLPAASSNIGRMYRIACADSRSPVTVAVTTGDYLDGVQNDTLALSNAGDHTCVVCHGTNGWFIY